MAAVSEDIYSLLVPLGGDWLVVPRSTVAEVIRYSIAEPDDGDEEWLVGSVMWNSLRIPVVSFEHLNGMSSPERGGRTRIVVIRPVSGSSTGPYGVLAEGFPQMVRVNREVLEVDRNFNPPADSVIICRVQMLQEQAFIPDLDTIEHKLANCAPA
jgi:chemosensory pili system protein ChpC